MRAASSGGGASGGLSGDALGLCAPDTAYLADLASEGGSEERDLHVRRAPERRGAEHEHRIRVRQLEPDRRRDEDAEVVDWPHRGGSLRGDAPG